MTHPVIKDKKVTCFNLSLKPRKERKYAISLIPVKKHKKGLISLVAKTVKDITNHLLMLVKIVSHWPLLQFTLFFYKNRFIRTKVFFPRNGSVAESCFYKSRKLNL